MVTDENVIRPEEKFKLKDMNSNFAFGIWSDKFEPLDMRAVSDFISLEATLVETKFDESLKALQFEIKELGLHICNDDDAFYEPVFHQKEFIPVFLSRALCFDSIDDIELWGNYDTSISQTIQVRVKRCKGKETCKSDEEIDEFIDRNGHLSVLSNVQKY